MLSAFYLAPRRQPFALASPAPSAFYHTAQRRQCFALVVSLFATPTRMEFYFYITTAKATSLALQMHAHAMQKPTYALLVSFKPLKQTLKPL